MAKYRVNAIKPTDDGSANVTYDISALDADGQPLLAKRVFIRVPADEVAAAEAQGLRRRCRASRMLLS